MKKKFLTFILAICFIIPAIFIFSACSQTPDLCDVSIRVNSTQNCVIYGDGEYAYGSKVVIAVIPNEGYEFKVWNDGHKNNIREVTVYKDMVFDAYIEAIMPTYALDKIEVYVEEFSNFSAENVEFNSLEIECDDTIIAKCDLSGNTNGFGIGASMVIAGGLNEGNIINHENNPIILYASRNDKNVFIKHPENMFIVQCCIVFSY